MDEKQALFWDAIESGDISSAEALFNEEISYENRLALRAFREAAVRGCIDTMEFLVARLNTSLDGDCEVTNGIKEWGLYDPICNAASKGVWNSVNWLIRNGACINSVHGCAPLYLASKAGVLDTVKLLVENGADTRGSINLNQSPLEIAEQLGHKDVAGYLSSVSMVRVTNGDKFPGEFTEFAQQVVDRAKKDRISQVTPFSDFASSAVVRNRDMTEEEYSMSRGILLEFMNEIFDSNVREDQGLVLSGEHREGVPIAVYPASRAEQSPAVFTIGFSKYQMSTPNESFLPERTEMFMLMPESWDCLNLDDSMNIWPFFLFSRLGELIQSNNWWIGLHSVFFGNLYPIVPERDFSTVLCLWNQPLPVLDVDVGFVQLVPIFESERTFALRHGIQALAVEFDKHDVGFVVDVDRRPVID